MNTNNQCALIMITHRLPLSQVEHAYKIFRNKEDNCVKVVMNPYS